jgi:hypothetical protein
MIDLNKPIKAEKGQDVDFSPAPKGEYTIRVREIKPWTAKTQDIKVIQRDENNRALKDEKGQNVTVLEKNLTIHSCLVTFEIVGTEQEGKRIFHNLTTHPNAPFSIPSFLYGLGIPELAASQIQTTCVGMMCLGNVDIETYDKKIVDQNTGLETFVEVPKNVIKSFKALPNELPKSDGNEDLGI